MEVKMKILFLILGIKNFIIWGFDFKYDYDFFTWLWFLNSVLFTGVYVFKNYIAQQTICHDEKNRR